MKKKIVIQVLILLWVLVSVSVYFFNFHTSSSHDCSLGERCLRASSINFNVSVNQSHQYYIEAFKNSIGQNSDKTHVFNPIIYILGGLLLLYLANFIYERFVEKRSKLSLRISPFYLFLIFTAIFFFCYERWLTFYNLETPIKYASIFVKYPLLILEISAIVLVVLSVGKRLFDRFFAKSFSFENNLPLFLFSFAFGLIALILSMFVLGMCHMLFFKYVLALLIALALVGFKNAWFWIKSFFRRDILVEASYLDPFIFLSLLTLVFVSLNFLELIRPLPLGFDDLTVYMNNPKTMAEEGRLLSGVMSHYDELFVSLGSIIFKSVNVSLLLSFLGSILSLIAVYFVSRHYFLTREFEPVRARSSAMLSATIFYTLPMTVFQSSKDLKVDLLSFFFVLLALFCFWRWKEDFSKSKKISVKVLFLSAFLVGFAVAVKYTNLIFLIVLLLYLAWTIFQKYRYSFGKYVLLFIFLGIAVLPILPITMRNIFQTRSLAPADIRFGRGEAESIKIDPPFSGDVSQPDFTKYMGHNSTGDYEEVGRYIGYEKWYKKYLLLPLRITENKNVFGAYVDIGFIFLAFVPLALALSRYVKSKKGRIIFIETACLGLVFWVMWTFTASGIIWYGLAGFIFLSTLTVETVVIIGDNFSRILYYFTIAVIIFWLSCATIIRAAFLPDYNFVIDPVGLRYARGEIDQKGYEDNKFQPYIGIMGEINKEIHQNPDNPPKVYRVGTFYKYMIDLNDRTVLDDQLLDKFAYVYQDKDSQKAMARFKNTGIKYIIVDRNLLNLDQTPNKSLTAKCNDFLQFLQDNKSELQLLTDPKDQRMMVFKVL